MVDGELNGAVGLFAPRQRDRVNLSQRKLAIPGKDVIQWADSCRSMAFVPLGQGPRVARLRYLHALISRVNVLQATCSLEGRWDCYVEGRPSCI